MTVSTGHVSEGRTVAAYWLAAIATVLTVLGLYVLPWWPSDYPDPTFLEYRAEYVADLADNTAPWWNAFHDSYFVVGFAVQTAAVCLLPFVVARRDRWHWLSVLAVLGAIWQLIGVLGSTIFHTTPAPFLGPLAGLLGLTAWLLARPAQRQQPRP
ncbi:hypothetical protein ACFU5O_16055 [Streptomyces sp. NPDC057445]|uniref:hypothetical protein n=1 Tax=Streptomyces sp. NPDC057445 TaxID=3346136 RepID=UPI0036BB4320